MLINYGFAIDENPFSAIEIDILELNDAFYNFFRSEILTQNPSNFLWDVLLWNFSVDKKYFMTKFNAWQYDADVTHIREYAHSKFKIFYDRIPFKMDDFFTHLFTGSFNFLHSYTGKWVKN